MNCYNTALECTPIPPCQGTYTNESCSYWDGDAMGCGGYYIYDLPHFYPCVYDYDNGTCGPYTIPCANTTTTTTSTSSSTTTTGGVTTTTTPVTLPANSILWIFTILTPILATVFTLCTLCCIGKGILPSIFASTLWYASSMWTTRIRFIDNFTVSMSPYYVDVGNWEVGTLYLAFAAIMAVYTVVLVLDFVYSNTIQQNG